MSENHDFNKEEKEIHEEKEEKIQPTDDLGELPELLSNEHYTQIIEDLTEENKMLKDKVLRSIAESENIRNRMNKTVEETREYAITNFAKDLVAATDNLSMALNHLPPTLDKVTEIIVEGVRMTKKEFENVFKKYGIESIDPQKGDGFDYRYHHAISQVSTEESKEGTIVDTMQMGYKIKDRLIRPASVVVAKK